MLDQACANINDDCKRNRAKQDNTEYGKRNGAEGNEYSMYKRYESFKLAPKQN